MKDLKVVFMGTPDFSVPVLQGLIDNCNVIGVVTKPDKEVGRNHEVSYSPIKRLALENNIKVLQPVKIRTDYQCVLDLNPDIIVTCAYGQIIPKEILEFPKYKCINVHASLLPKLRGGAPIHRAILNDYKETGITIMYMAEGMDDGDIISQEKVEITDSMTVLELHDILSTMGRDLLLKTLPSIVDESCNRIKQNEEEVTFAKIIKREDELIDFNLPTREIYNKIRGLSPFPGAYSIMDGKIVKIFSSVVGVNNSKMIPGQVVNIYKDGIGVKTLDGEIIIKELQMEGKKRMLVSSYLNGVNKSELLSKRFVKE